MDSKPTFFLAIQKREAIIALAVALFTSILAILWLQFIMTLLPGPCRSGSLLWAGRLSTFLATLPVTFWAAIGGIRFVGNERRHIGHLGEFSRIGHLSFFLPALFLLAIFFGFFGLIVVAFAAIAILLLLIAAYKQHRPLLGSHILIISGNAFMGALILMASVYGVIIGAFFCMLNFFLSF